MSSALRALVHGEVARGCYIPAAKWTATRCKFGQFVSIKASAAGLALALSFDDPLNFRTYGALEITREYISLLRDSFAVDRLAAGLLKQIARAARKYPI
jgi:hypothetical protein